MKNDRVESQVAVNQAFRGRPRSDEGIVLIIVLWILLGMSLLALSFSAAIRTEVDAARNIVQQKQAFYAARAGVEYAAYRVIQAHSAFFEVQQRQDLEFGESSFKVPTEAALDFGNGGVRVEILDESGKLNLNLASEHLIYNLLLIIGVSAAEADVITDSILDWRDLDEEPLPSGAESSYYQSLPEPYFAKNGYFDAPEEVLLVRGVTPEIYYGRKGQLPSGERITYYGLQNYVTTFTSLNRINLNSAPLPVLAAVEGLDVRAAEELVRLRRQSPITDVSEIAFKIPGISTEALAYLSAAPSSVYTLISEGYVADSEVVSRIRCVIRLRGLNQSGYSVLYWNESDTEF